MKKTQVDRASRRVMPELLPRAALRAVGGAFASRSPPPQQEPSPGVVASPGGTTGGL